MKHSAITLTGEPSRILELESPNKKEIFRRAKRIATFVSLLALVFSGASALQAQTPVVTQHNDNSRTGQNNNETILTPSNVNTNSFGKLFSYSIVGQAYAQPLYVPGITMGAGTAQAGAKHNVIFVATEHDNVYAFDADNNGGANAAPLWSISLLDGAHGAAGGATTVPNGDVSTGDINPEIGVTGTPVIDTTTNTMYVVGKSKENGNYVQRLHALDITTGAEKSNSPVTLSGQVAGNGNGSSGGVLNWDPKWENNRPGLLLLNGIVYIGFAAHGDNGPWHGWILAYNASSLQQTSAFCSTANGSGSGVWMSGTGLAADTINNGRLFVATGNGAFTADTPPYTNTMSYGDDIVRLDVSNGVLNVGDHFTPLNQSTLNGGDTDLGSGGVVLLPDQASGGHAHLMIEAGKEGRIYLVDRDSLGGYNSGSDNIVQEIPPNNSSVSGNLKISGVWGAPAYWNGNIYFWASNDSLKAFSLTNGTLGNLDSNNLASPTSNSSETGGYPGPTPAVSSNGNSNAIVWSIITSAYNSGGPAVLLAHNATNVSSTLFRSDQNSSRDNPGPAVKFAVPTVTNGKVYVGTANLLSIYGPLVAASQAAAPALSPGGETFAGSVAVTITDSTPNATIYYTTNGSTPTTSSAIYTGPITVTSTDTVSAVASASGFLQSAVSSETYNLQNQAIAPTFSPVAGSFASAQLVTLSSDTAGAKIYYTTDGSTPVPGSGTTLLYGSAITVNSTETIKAVAALAGSTTSPVASGTYTIVVGGVGINFVDGFSTSQSVMTFNGSTVLNDTRLQLTNGGMNQAGSAWFNTPVNITSFTNDFAFQLENANADGITFAIQASGLPAIGGSGEGLGYGGIAKSVAMKFDLYSNNGEGDDSTGLYQNGADPSTPAIDLTSSGIDLHNGDTFSVHMTYDGTTLTMTITDGVTGAVFNTSWPINIPQVIGSNTAYVGFTGGTGGLTASQKIETWTYLTSAASASAAATPTFNLASGVYLGTQTVMLSDSTAGAAIFYTTDGSTPAASAGGATLAYNGALTLTATQTINAIAKSSTTAASAVASATYTIEQQATAPIFSPAPGTFAAAQNVTLSTPTPGAAIYYTVDGTRPTPNSTLYSGPISVGSSEAVQAIAVVNGFFNSAVATGVYTINSTPGGTGVSLGAGFTAGAMVLNGSAKLNGTSLQLTDSGSAEAGSAWYNAPLNVQQFSTSFSFQLAAGTNPIADGITFSIQGNNAAALGPNGGGLGYGSDNTGSGNAGSINHSVAVKFDTFNNTGEGTDSTGLYTNGASPTTPSVDLTGSGIDLHSGDVFNVNLNYDGTTLTMTITDPKVNASFTNFWPVNVPSIIGGNTAYVGFTGGTGANTAVQSILGWSFSSTASTATPPPGGGGSGSTTAINFGSGFSATGLQLNGTATLVGSSLQLTDTSTNSEDGSAFWTTKVGVQNFTNDFTFRLTNPAADGMTFTLQGNAPTSLGASGGNLGYAGIGSSVAVKFDLYDNQGEGINSTGLYVNGAFPGTPATALGGGVDLHSGDVFAVHMTYDGTTLTVTITDTANPTQTFTTSWPLDVVGTVGGSSAYAGFTGATGGSVATQQILTWSYSTGKPPMVIAASSLVAGAVSSGPGVRTFNYPSFPNGTGAILDSTAVGDNVTFTVNVPTAGTYDVKIAYKEYAPRGILQTAVNGTNLGAAVDEFLASGDAYNTSDLGVLNFATAGNYSFKFTVVGHNAASSGYNLSFGAFTLTPQ